MLKLMYKFKFILFLFLCTILNSLNCFSDIPKEFKFVEKQTRILRYNTEVIRIPFQDADLLQYTNLLIFVDLQPE